MTGRLKFACSLLRVFRLPALLERLGLWRRSEMYQAIVETLRITMPQLLKILNLLVLLLFISASFCVQVFGGIKTGTRLGRTANFEDVPRAFLTLLQIVFGDEWHEIMDDCSIQSPACTSSVQNVTIQGDPFADCGIDKMQSFIIFFAFKMIAEWIVINLVTGMLVNSFTFCAAQHDVSKAILTPEFVNDLRLVWDKHDHARRGYIRLDELYAFMRECPLPLGLGPIDGYVKKFLPVRCELAVIAQHRNRARQHLLNTCVCQPLCSASMNIYE